VLNLVRNAEEAVADARTPNGHITVVARRLEAPARIEISIVDNGPGITAEVTERLFHPLTTSKTGLVWAYRSRLRSSRPTAGASGCRQAGPE